MASSVPWKAVSLDEIERVDWRRTGVTWLPVRAALETDIVGMGGFVATHAGQCLIEPHREDRDGRGQQEVYIVMRGAAHFVIDGAAVDVPAGSMIRVDPEAQREATATVDDTFVLALGGESVFEPAASEWIERARPLIRNDRAAAAEILADLKRVDPTDRANDVGEALLAVGRGDDRTARRIVERLIMEAPPIRDVLKADPDLAEFVPAAAVERRG